MRWHCWLGGRKGDPAFRNLNVVGRLCWLWHVVSVLYKISSQSISWFFSSPMLSVCCRWWFSWSFACLIRVAVVTGLTFRYRLTQVGVDIGHDDDDDDDDDNDDGGGDDGDDDEWQCSLLITTLTVAWRCRTWSVSPTSAVSQCCAVISTLASVSVSQLISSI